MWNALLVGAGGFAGALLRYGLTGLVYRHLPHATFPFGTLAVNLLGCLAIGGLAGLLDSRGLLAPELRAFAFVGLLGGFTTFSTFGYETLLLAREGELLRAGAYVAAHVVLGVALVGLAYLATSSR